jgi:hypothetical protein
MEVNPGAVVQLGCGGRHMVVACADESPLQTAIERIVAERDPSPPFAYSACFAVPCGRNRPRDAEPGQTCAPLSSSCSSTGAGRTVG